MTVAATQQYPTLEQYGYNKAPHTYACFERRLDEILPNFNYILFNQGGRMRIISPTLANKMPALSIMDFWVSYSSASRAQSEQSFNELLRCIVDDEFPNEINFACWSCGKHNIKASSSNGYGRTLRNCAICDYAYHWERTIQ